MARIRTIKPELASDVKLASVSRDARYTFVLLITQADDEGLIAGSHRQLLGVLYPHDDNVSTADMLSWVEELVVIGLLRWRATTEGAPVIEIANWTKHQRVDNKGRSQLAHILAPIAELRGESLRLAEDRRLEVGSRTLDLGSRTEDRPPTSAGDPIKEFTTEFIFGSCEPAVAGLIRSARNSLAIIATLRLHLTGEMGAELCTPPQLGLACQQYLANGKEFNAAFFAGFIRRAKKGVEMTENRKRNSAEGQSVEVEKRQREREAREAEAADRSAAAFKDSNPERYAELLAAAEHAVPKKITMGRADMVRAHLLRAIRGEAAA